MLFLLLACSDPSVDLGPHRRARPDTDTGADSLDTGEPVDTGATDTAQDSTQDSPTDTATDTAGDTSESVPVDTAEDTAEDTGTPCVPLLWYVDVDADGYGADVVSACDQPTGTSATDGDCDDANATTHPGAADDAEDGVDNDCDGAVDEDWDPCSTPYGYTYTEVDSYVMAGAGSVVMGNVGTGWVCSASCDVWYVTVDACDGDACATVLALPVLATPDTFRVRLNGVMPDADGGVGVCTLVTSAGNLVYTLTLY